MIEDDIMQSIYDMNPPTFSEKGMTVEFKHHLNKITSLKERQAYMQQQIDELEQKIKNYPIYGATDPAVIASYIDLKRNLNLLKSWKNDLHTEEIGIAYEFYNKCIEMWVKKELNPVIEHIESVGTTLLASKFVGSKPDEYFNLNSNIYLDRQKCIKVFSEFADFIIESLKEKESPLD